MLWHLQFDKGNWHEVNWVVVADDEEHAKDRLRDRVFKEYTKEDAVNVWAEIEKKGKWSVIEDGIENFDWTM